MVYNSDGTEKICALLQPKKVVADYKDKQNSTDANMNKAQQSDDSEIPRLFTPLKDKN